jgi:hypothetical protein
MQNGYRIARVRTVYAIPVLMVAYLFSQDAYLIWIRQEMTMTIKESLKNLIGQFQKTNELIRFIGYFNTSQ